MSVRTWNASGGGNLVLFGYMIFFSLIAIWGTASTRGASFPAYFALFYTLLILSSWIFGFYYRCKHKRQPSSITRYNWGPSEVKTNSRDTCPRCGWQDIEQIGKKNNLQQSIDYRCRHCSNRWNVPHGANVPS
jgi:hypothetical protein